MSINQLEKKNNYSLNCENLYVDDSLIMGIGSTGTFDNLIANNLVVNGTITATNILAGGYSPVYSGSSNFVNALTDYAVYTDINNIVTVYLTINVGVTNQTNPTIFFVSIPPLPVPQPTPFPSTFSVSGNGTQVNNINGTTAIFISADVGTLNAQINCPPAGGSTGNLFIYCYFSYVA
jgi:hypothetical protein